MLLARECISHRDVSDCHETRPRRCLGALLCLASVAHHQCCIEPGGPAWWATLSAFLLLLTGVWLLHAAAFLYMYADTSTDADFRGLHQSLWREAPDPTEAVAAYLAIDVQLCAAMVAAQSRRCASNEKRPAAYASGPAAAALVASADDGII